MWAFIHKLGSPKWFYGISAKLQPWFWAAAALLIVTGSLWGLAFAPADYQQGNSFRIIYVHVPAAFLAQSIFIAMAVSGLVFMVWKIKVADMAASVLAMVGVINIPIIKYSVDWWYTLHQPASFTLTSRPAMPTEMWLPLVIMVLGFYCFFIALTLMRTRSEILRREANKHWVQELVAGQVVKVPAEEAR